MKTNLRLLFLVAGLFLSSTQTSCMMSAGSSTIQKLIAPLAKTIAPMPKKKHCSETKQQPPFPVLPLDWNKTDSLSEEEAFDIVKSQRDLLKKQFTLLTSSATSNNPQINVNLSKLESQHESLFKSLQASKKYQNDEESRSLIKNRLISTMNNMAITMNNVAILIHDALQTELRQGEDLIAVQYLAETIAPNGHRPLVCSLVTDPKTTAAYHPALDAFNLTKNYHDLPPARKILILMHECRHRLQALNKLRTFNDGASLTPEDIKFYPQNVLTKQQENPNATWKIFEYDADYFAFSNITCPTCLQINKFLHDGEESEGYIPYLSAEFDTFTESIKNNACCPAHSLSSEDDDHNSIVQKLKNALEEYALIQDYGSASKTFVKNVESLQNALNTEKNEHARTRIKDKAKETLNKHDQSVLLLKSIEDLDSQSGSLLQHIPGYLPSQKRPTE